MRSPLVKWPIPARMRWIRVLRPLRSGGWRSSLLASEATYKPASFRPFSIAERPSSIRSDGARPTIRRITTSASSKQARASPGLPFRAESFPSGIFGRTIAVGRKDPAAWLQQACFELARTTRHILTSRGAYSAYTAGLRQYRLRRLRPQSILNRGAGPFRGVLNSFRESALRSIE